ncbi:MAG: ABC transporter permease [Nitrospinota bacterium]|nr:MAG: ABC transporter permease [Nitrospinota bacterium]
MRKYLVHRLFQSIFALFGVSIVVFLIMHLGPGDPVLMLVPEDAPKETIAEVRREMGLDLPLHLQYLRFLRNAFTGKLYSYYRAGGALELVLDKVPATVELALAATIVSVLLGIPTGIIAATRRGTIPDYLSNVVALFGISTPNFWLGIMLILLFAETLQFLPSFGRGPAFIDALGQLLHGDVHPLVQSIKHIAMPAITLGTYYTAVMMRLMRTGILEEFGKGYVEAGRAKGLPEQIITYKHVFGNAVLSVVTVLGLQIGSLIGGSAITETVFAWPGAGQLLIDSIYVRDFPVVQAGILFAGLAFVFINLAVDVFYTVLDPRIRYEREMT